jgi:tRNA-2-methylthio-N6-dimethylallyladenosine synthase
MGPKVSEAEAGSRLARLITLQNRITRERNTELTGREFELLIEAPASRGNGVLGRTRSNRTVIVKGPAVPGDIVPVRITGTRGWTPLGETEATASALLH